MGVKSRLIEERFWPKVDKSKEIDGCWIWIAAKDKGGYGVIRNEKGKLERAHRTSWTIANGPIKDGLFVCHKCDVRACINPEHMFLGTNTDNVRDMIKKGRANPARGEYSGKAKLCESDVIAIRSSTGIQQEIADAFCIGRTTVRQILNRETWRHVKLL